MKSKIAAFFGADEPSSEDESSLPEENATATARATLYQCPSCDVVYVADEKRRCSQCDEAVVAVDE